MKNLKYKPYGMTIYIYYKNGKVKQYINVSNFNLIEGEIAIWICYKVRPIIRKIKSIVTFMCEYTRY